MDRQLFLHDVTRELRRLKRLAENAIDQVNDASLFTRLDAESNSIAVLMKHLAGNMKSRWTDFLTTDGEKSDRHRDREFSLVSHDDRAAVQQAWEEGWGILFSTLNELSLDDLERSVTIRGESHLVPQAILRQLTHYSYHVGQIIFVARHLVGEDWRTLSIPRDRSAEFLTKPGNYLSG